MEFTNLYSTTLISEMPGIINGNFQAVSNYLDVFYDEDLGIIISPVNTPGRVKGATGEFVTLTVDNLIVKSQYTNLYENITTANYDYWVTYTGVASPLRDPCTAASFWPAENASYKYIDVQNPYYKINPDVPVALNTDLKSQIVQLILDASGTIPGTYRILLDPSTSRYLDILVDASMVADGTETKWVSLFCVNYNASTGASWEVYEFGDSAAGTGSSGSGGGVTTVYVQNAITAAIAPFSTNLSAIPVTYATNASLYSVFATNVSVGLSIANFANNASVNLAVANFATNASVNTAIITNSSLGATSALATALNSSIGLYATNVSVGTALGLRDASITSLFTRSNTYNASIGTLTSRLNLTDASLYALTNRTGVIDGSISFIKAQYIPNSSLSSDFIWNAGSLEVSMGAVAGLELLASNVSVGLAFASNASLGNLSIKANYIDASLAALTNRHNITETSLGTLEISSQSFATNTSVGLAFITNTSLGNVSQLVYALNSSTGSGLGAYATNASVNLAIANYATNSSVNSAISIFATNTSVNNTLVDYAKLTYVDASIDNLRAVPIKDSCLGGGLSWSSGVLYVDVSTIAGGVTLQYVDGSFASRDNAISLRATNVSIGLAFASNSSLGNISQLTYALNSSLGMYATNASVNLSIANFATNTSVNNAISVFATNTSVNAAINNAFLTNVSLGNVSQLVYAINASTGSGLGAYATNASVNLAIANFSTNASVNLAIANFATNTSINTAFTTNTSLGNVSQLVYALNTSIGSGLGDYATNTSVGLAFTTNTSLGNTSQLAYTLNSSIGIYATNASVNLAIANYATNSSVNTAITNFSTNASVNAAIAYFSTNASVNNALAQYLRSASIGTTLYWSAGILNVSTGTGYTTFAYVDGSLSNHQNQINSLANRVTTLETSTGNATFAYVDGSLSARDASISRIFPLVFALNTSMGSGLILYATNASVNAAFASNSSIGRIDVSLRVIYPLVFKTNASLGNLTQIKFDACIGYLTSRINVVDNSTFFWRVYIDGSLSIISGNISTLNSQVGTLNGQMTTLTNRHNITETSVGALNASLNNAFLISSYVDSSSILKAIYIPEVSLNDSYFKWTSGLLEPSVSGTGISSLSTLTDSSIVSPSNNDYLKYDSSWGKWVNQTPVDASTTLLLSNLYDVSIVDISSNDYLRYDYTSGKWINERTLEASVYYYTKTQVDASFALKTDVEASLNNVAYLWSYVDSSSYAKATYISNASLNTSYFAWSGGLLITSSTGGFGVTNIAALTDVSIKSITNNDLLKYDSSFGKWMNAAPVDVSDYFYTKTQVDASFALKSAVEASLNDVLNIASYVNSSSYYETSIGAIWTYLNDYIEASTMLVNYINDASLNQSKFKWVSGLLEPSVAGGTGDVTKAYVDGSILTLTSYVNAINTSLGDYVDISTLFYSRDQVDASFVLTSTITNYIKDTSLSGSYFNWNAGYLEASAAGGSGISQAYVDGSIANFATNASVNLAFYSNVSLGLVGVSSTTLAALTDVSIKSITNNDLLKYDSSFGKWMNVAPVDACSYFYTKTQIDSSFALIVDLGKTDTSLYNVSLLSSVFNTSIGWLDASIKAAFSKNNAQDASITRIDASLNNSFLLSSYINTSEYYDGSLNRINASLGDVLNISAYVDSSSVLKALYIPEVSLNDSYFKWASGLLEPSISGSGVSSISTLTDVSIVSLANNNYLRYDASNLVWKNTASEDASEFFYTKYEINSSLGPVISLLNAINTSLGDYVDISTLFYTKTQVDASFISTTSKTFQTLSITDVSTDWNIRTSYNAKVTLTQDISLNILNLLSGDSGTLIVKQDGTGGRTITLPVGSVKNGAWTLSITANTTDILSFLYDGSFYWNRGGPYT